MSGGVQVAHRDTDYLCTGTQKGSGTTITDQGKDFKSCGVVKDLAVYNDTASTTGKVVSCTENTVVTNIAFNAGATYRIFKTDTYNSLISKHFTDRRYGDKVTHQWELQDGLKPRDRDYDETYRNTFGPGQPWRD
jgi:hypothetical protein